MDDDADANAISTFIYFLHAKLHLFENLRCLCADSLKIPFVFTMEFLFEQLKRRKKKKTIA